MEFKMIEGKYKNAKEAQSHIDKVCKKYKIDKLKELEFDYWFSSSDIIQLQSLISRLANDGFSNCHEIYIDEDDAKACWTPSKTMKYNGDIVVAEIHKYSLIAKAHNCKLSGIIMSYRQPQNK